MGEGGTAGARPAIRYGVCHTPVCTQRKESIPRGDVGLVDSAWVTFACIYFGLKE